MIFRNRYQLPHILRGCAAVLLMAGSSMAYPAAPALGDIKDWATATPGELDAVRGGFSLSDNSGLLQISIGIERAVFVDGILRVSTAFDIPLQGGQLAGGGLNLPTLNLVQNGMGNRFVPSRLADLPANVMTLVQNSLDNQSISNVNIINATVTNKSLLRSMAVVSSLRDMLVYSIH